MASITMNGTYGNGYDRYSSPLDVSQGENLTVSTLFNRYNDNIDLSIRVRDLYQLSIKNYLNKSFNKSWDLINELMARGEWTTMDEELGVKIYKLYFSLYDLLLKHEFDVGDDQEREILVEKFHNGGLYDELVTNNSLEVDPELYLIVFIIERSNDMQLDLLSRQMETFLREKIPSGDKMDKYPLKIFKLYCFNVLAHLDDRDGTGRAQDFINRYLIAEQDVIKLEYLDKLQHIKSDLQKRQLEADEIERKKQDRERETATTKSSHATARKSPEDTANSVSKAPTNTVTPPRSTPRWKQLEKLVKQFRKFNHSLSSNNVLMVLLLIIGFLLSLKRNKSLLLNTLKMVFKISYV